jgi:hypothetical protein
VNEDWAPSSRKDASMGTDAPTIVISGKVEPSHFAAGC